MRFAIVTETWPPEVNGVALTVRGFACGLARLGHAVALVRPRQPQDVAPSLERASPQRRVPSPRVDSVQSVPVETCPITHLPLGSELLVAGAGLPRYPGLRFGFPAGARLLQQWRRARPDAIYVATEGPLGWSAVRSARRLGIPVASGFHTRFDDYMSRYGAGFLTPVVFAWLRRFHTLADATLVPTQELADDLRTRGITNVRLLRRAVDTQRFAPERRSATLRREWGLDPDALAVIHVGRLAPEKNLDLAFRTFRRIQAERPQARFIVVGDGPSRAALQAANPDVIFAGMQHGDALATHYASADLFLFPSLSETFGNVTLEAMASGVATVAYDYGAAREHLRDGQHGAAVPRGDEAAFAAAAQQLARDAELRRLLGAQARRAVADLDPAGVAERLADLLTELARRRAA